MRDLAQQLDNADRQMVSQAATLWILRRLQFAEEPVPELVLIREAAGDGHTEDEIRLALAAGRDGVGWVFLPTGRPRAWRVAER